MTAALLCPEYDNDIDSNTAAIEPYSAAQHPHSLQLEQLSADISFQSARCRTLAFDLTDMSSRSSSEGEEEENIYLGGETGICDLISSRIRRLMPTPSCYTLPSG